MIKKTVIYDENTGEKISEKQRYFPPAFDEEKGYLFWPRKNFCRSFHDVEFPSELNDLEIGRMARLAKRIWSNTNMLGYRGNGGVRPHTIDTISEILGMQPRQAYRFIEKMIRLGVLARVKIETEARKETHLYVNPMYFFSSNRIPLNLYLLFRHSLDQHLPTRAIEQYAAQERMINSKK
ncbi:MAG: hypothetical protein WC749_02460 [Dehalococcoidia bacterium]